MRQIVPVSSRIRYWQVLLDNGLCTLSGYWVTPIYHFYANWPGKLTLREFRRGVAGRSPFQYVSQADGDCGENYPKWVKRS